MASLRDNRGHGIGWAQGRHASRWEADTEIPKVAAAAGIEADPDDDQGAAMQAAHNRHLQQRSADINQFKLEMKQLAKSKRQSTATKVSKPEHKASKRVLIQAKDDREVNGEPEAKKSKPNENEHDSSSAPATVGISALEGYSSDSSESSQREGSASSLE